MNISVSGEAPADLQVHAHGQEPASPGDAGSDGGSRPSGSAGRAHPGPGASDRLHAGRRSSPGAEADAGRASVPAERRNLTRIRGRRQNSRNTWPGSFVWMPSK